MDDLQRVTIWLVGGSVFGLVVSIWLIGMLLWYLRRSSDGGKVEQRLGLARGMNSGKPRVLRLWHEGRVTTTTVPGKRNRTSPLAYLDQIRRGLGWDVPIITMVLGFIGVVSLGFVIVLGLTGDVLIALVGAAAAVIIPWMYAKRRLNRRTELFEQQLADALGLATRSLRAGHPLLGALRLIVEEMEPPVSTVFAEIWQQQALGASLDDAIRAAAVRSGSSDMKLLAASMGIQLRSGGHLADMMERLAKVIRDRLKLHRRARILTSQTQLSKRVLIAIPFVIFAVLYFISPGYLEPLYSTPMGRLLLIVAGACLLLGSWVMNRITILRY